MVDRAVDVEVEAEIEVVVVERRDEIGRHQRAALLHESELARTDPDPQFLHRPMRYDIGLPSPVI